MFSLKSHPMYMIKGKKEMSLSHKLKCSNPFIFASLGYNSFILDSIRLFYLTEFMMSN